MGRIGRTAPVGAVAIGVLALLAAAAGGCTAIRPFFSRRNPAPPARAVARPAPPSAAAHYRLGRLYHERRRHREAAVEFRKALAVEPGDPKAWNGLGAALDALGEYPAAADAYARAIDLDPSLDYVHNNLGYSCLLRGDRAGAAVAFARALALNPANTVARNNFGLLGGYGTQPPSATPAPPPAITPTTTPTDAPTNTTAVTPAVSAPALLAVAAPAPATPPAGMPGVPPAAISPVPPPAPQSAPVAQAPPLPLPPATPPATPPAPPAPALQAGPAVVIAAGADATVLVPATGADGTLYRSTTGTGSVRLRRVSVEELRNEYGVGVEDGSGSAGLLDEVLSLLARQGFRVERVPPSVARRRERTMILYREGALQPAYQVAQAFPGYQEMKRTDAASPGSSVVVLLGRDMGASRRLFVANARP